MTKIFSMLMVAILLVAGSLITSVNACTRVVYHGEGNTVLTARSMDWKEDCLTNLWIFPRGMERNGEVGPASFKWTSKYGSVITAAYDFCTTDGMNEKGLVANLLWLAESQYPEWDGTSPAMAITVWTQYVLDSFATVAETVEEMRKGRFVVVSDMMPDGSRMAALHLSISDPSGDSAIFEYLNGELVIHHDRSYHVMTNSPVFHEQLALNNYWKNIGGLTFLPGTNRAADRFVRASYYIDVIPKTSDMQIAVASVFSVIRNASVPYGITTPNEPNISSTRWRTVSDQENLVYFYESTLSPNVFWVNFPSVDFGGEVKKLDLVGGQTYSGNAAAKFVAMKPFRFLGVNQE